MLRARFRKAAKLKYTPRVVDLIVTMGESTANSRLGRETRQWEAKRGETRRDERGPTP